MPSLAWLDPVLFAVLPYVALMLFLAGTIWRYRAQKFTYSSLSSQFLENQHHFWALVPFHYGIIAITVGHLVGFLIPREVLLWNSRPLRLWILEASALAFGLLTLIGLLGIIVRRANDSKLRRVTSAADWIVYALLLISVFTGVYTAVFHPWGSSWFATTLSPYLWSLVKLRPDAALLGGLPWSIKLHIVNAWLVIGFFPFSRLVHILVAPNPYLWRKPQVVRWYRPAMRRS
ncbi:respiratory nitrate reductase subunit gamma [bacterium]|nr:MAG: respiratory nitrate reductase subunit gamma [bacterium]